MRETVLLLVGAAVLAVGTPLRAESVETRPCAAFTGSARLFPFFSILESRSVRSDATLEEVEEGPAWTPDSGEDPPVSPARAIALASDDFERHFEQAEDWRLGSVWSLTWTPKDTGLIGHERAKPLRR